MDTDENVNESYLFFTGSKDEHFSKRIQYKYTLGMTVKPHVPVIG